jgi:hypothetical protein
MFLESSLLLLGLTSACAERQTPTVISVPTIPNTATATPTGPIVTPTVSIVATTTIAPTIPTVKQVTITGWFTTIWDEKPHYSITDDQGQRTDILFDEELAKSYGGALTFDRKRVTIIGEAMNNPPGLVRVVSIKLEKN